MPCGSSSSSFPMLLGICPSETETRDLLELPGAPWELLPLPPGELPRWKMTRDSKEGQEEEHEKTKRKAEEKKGEGNEAEKRQLWELSTGSVDVVMPQEQEGVKRKEGRV